MASLASLMYPSVTVPSYSTETTINTSTIVIASSYVNVNTILNWWTYSVTSLYQGYGPGGGCWGGGGCFYLISATVTNQVTTEYSITVSSTGQMEITNQLAYSKELVHTYSRSIPLYVSFGMNDIDLVLLAALFLVLGAFAVAYYHGSIMRRKQAKSSEFMSMPLSCVKCGTTLPPNSKFCNNCGARQS